MRVIQAHKHLEAGLIPGASEFFENSSRHGGAWNKTAHPAVAGPGVGVKIFFARGNKSGFVPVHGHVD
ncbi:MAG: hypothetical protein AB1831_04415 [Pseudomonadota bacterium]